MNRILFHSDEIKNSSVTLSDGRSVHILNVLHGSVGQILKTGEIDGLVGNSEIMSINIGQKPSVTLKVCHETPSLEPWFDLVLAPPRPRAFKRLLPQLVQLGVGKIVLVGAKKVEKDFWGATILKPELHQPLMIDALMQSGTTFMPEILIRRNFRKFIAEELDLMFPSSARIVGHPDGSKVSSFSSEGKVLIAIGPEGGWTDDEVSLLASKNFMPYSLGGRILKTDTAAVALISRLMNI